jgi:hypothetical protein
MTVPQSVAKYYKNLRAAAEFREQNNSRRDAECAEEINCKVKVGAELRLSKFVAWRVAVSLSRQFSCHFLARCDVISEACVFAMVSGWPQGRIVG